MKKGVTIIPVRIEDVEPTKSMEYFLGAIHWLDALTPPLEQHLKHLAETISAMLRAKAAQEGVPPTTRPPPALQTPATPSTTGTPFAKDHGGPAAAHGARRLVLLSAGLGVAALALIGAAIGFYMYLTKPKHPLGPPLDGWTLSGGEILRYYPSPSQEDCRADCERAGEDCMGYTWVKPGGYNPGDGPMCYLNRWYNAITKHSCCITANRGGTVPR